MKLLMISGDRSVLQGKKSAFWYTLEEFSKHWDRIDVISPHVSGVESGKWKVESDSQYSIPHSTFHIPHLANVFFHPSPKSLWYQPLWIKQRGSELITQHHHDVMTVHEYPPFYNGLGAKRLHAKTGIPYCSEIHHIVGWPFPASLQERTGFWMSRLFLRWIVKNASGVRVVNNSVHDELTSWGVSPDRMSVVPSFYLDSERLSAVRQVPVIYDVAFCARLVANKGAAELIDAAATLKNIRMVIIGEGPEHDSLKNRVMDKGMEGRITFTGWLTDQDAVLEAIKGARIFVMNSKSEGGPRVLLEAMGCGMPVISTRVGIAPDVIEDGENGIFTTGAPDDLAQQIRHLLDDEQHRLSMGMNAMNVLQRFNRADGIRVYADYLKQLV